jgi:hypothetical protein
MTTYQDIMEEMTPVLHIQEKIHAVWDSRGLIKVFWYNQQIFIDPAELNLNGLTDLRESIHQYLDSSMVSSLEEIYHTGAYKAYSPRGWEIHVPRTHSCSHTSIDDLPIEYLLTPSLDSYTVTSHGSVLNIQGTKYDPGFLISSGIGSMETLLSDYLDISDNMRFLLSGTPHEQLVVGHENLINRMSEEMLTDHCVLSSKDIEQLSQEMRNG